MIFYATKKTIERYRLPMPEDFEDPQYPVTLKSDGKTEYFFPAEQFEKLLLERYAKK